ncbi:MFS transporter [Candidatus Amesbacteria bacterium]|nr:MFS transporter [Candidatus Amesbacteria bacterium]
MSQLTVNLVNFLLLTRVFASTGSTIAVSLIWVAWSLPALLFGPFSGSLVDSFSRRRVMFVTNLLQACTVASYFLLKNHVFAIYFVVFTYSLFDQLYIPSQQAALPGLIDKKLLSAANGIFLLTQQASFLVGMGLGGIFLSLFGPMFAIIVSSLALLIAAVAVFYLPPDSPRTPAWEKSLDQFIGDFRHGFSFVKNHRSVLLPLALIVGFQIFISIIAIILPSYTRDSLHLDLNHAGITLLVPASLAALLFTRSLPRLLHLHRKKTLVQTGFLVSSVSLALLASLPIWPAGRLPASILIAVGLGMSLTAIMVPTQTLLQEKTPPWFRGRVYGSLGFLMTVATSLPLIAAAAVTDLFGPSSILSLLAILLFGTFILIYRRGDYVLANGLGF